MYRLSPGPFVAHPGSAVAGAPEREVGVRVVGAGDPDRRASGFPFVAGRPGVAPGLPGRRDHIRLPRLLAGLEIVGGDEAANPALAARHADNDLAAGNERRERHVVAAVVVGHLRGPDLLARPGVERHERRLARREEDLVAMQRDAAARRMLHDGVLRQRPLVPPQHRALRRIERNHLIARGGDEHHAAVDERRRLMAAGGAGGKHPQRLKAVRVLRRNLIERAVAPSIVGASQHEPVARVRPPQTFGGHGGVRLQDRRHRHGWWRIGRRREGLLRAQRYSERARQHRRSEQPFQQRETSLSPFRIQRAT